MPLFGTTFHLDKINMYDYNVVPHQSESNKPHLAAHCAKCQNDLYILHEWLTNILLQMIV